MTSQLGIEQGENNSKKGDYQEAKVLLAWGRGLQRKNPDKQKPMADVLFQI